MLQKEIEEKQCFSNLNWKTVIYWIWLILVHIIIRMRQKADLINRRNNENFHNWSPCKNVAEKMEAFAFITKNIFDQGTKNINLHAILFFDNMVLLPGSNKNTSKTEVSVMLISNVDQCFQLNILRQNHWWNYCLKQHVFQKKLNNELFWINNWQRETSRSSRRLQFKSS